MACPMHGPTYLASNRSYDARSLVPRTNVRTTSSDALLLRSDCRPTDRSSFLSARVNGERLRHGSAYFLARGGFHMLMAIRDFSQKPRAKIRISSRYVVVNFRTKKFLRSLPQYITPAVIASPVRSVRILHNDVLHSFAIPPFFT